MYTTNLAENWAIPPRVIVGDKPATVLYFGSAPGYPGYYQVNFQVPSLRTPVVVAPVRLGYIGRWSNGVAMYVR